MFIELNVDVVDGRGGIWLMCFIYGNAKGREVSYKACFIVRPEIRLLADRASS